MTKALIAARTTKSTSLSTQQQLSIAFDSIQLRALSRNERTKARSSLAYVLLQAAGVAAKERDDDQR